MRLSTQICAKLYNKNKKGIKMRRFNNRLRDLREDKDLTQAEIAKRFYLQTTQYRRYENGESDLPLEWAKKFARYYNVSIDYIAGLIETPEKLERF